MIFTNIKRRKALSAWTWSDCAKIFDIDIDKDFQSFKIASCKVPTNIMNKLKDRLEDSRLTHGSLINANEARRKNFINDFLVSACRFIPSYCLRIEDEGVLQSLDANGSCEFVIKSLKDLCIIYVVEAKTIDVVKGGPQLLMELHAGQFMNRAAKLKFPYMYGIVTTADVWHIYKWDIQSRKVFRNAMILQNLTETGPIEAIMEMVYNITLDMLEVASNASLASWIDFNPDHKSIPARTNITKSISDFHAKAQLATNAESAQNVLTESSIVISEAVKVLEALPLEDRI